MSTSRGGRSGPPKHGKAALGPSEVGGSSFSGLGSLMRGPGAAAQAWGYCRLHPGHVRVVRSVSPPAAKRRRVRGRPVGWRRPVPAGPVLPGAGEQPAGPPGLPSPAQRALGRARVWRGGGCGAAGCWAGYGALWAAIRSTGGGTSWRAPCARGRCARARAAFGQAGAQRLLLGARCRARSWADWDIAQLCAYRIFNCSICISWLLGGTA